MVDWDAIVAREGPAVWRTVARLVGNRADAEDCFQETFLSALVVWRREAVANPHALLQRMATVRALDRLRQRYRLARRESGSGEWGQFHAAGLDPLQDAQAAELSDRLRAALCELPPRQSEAFCLFALEGWSYEQIASHLDSSANAVGVLLHRARHTLQELLSGSQVGSIKRDDPDER